MNWLNNIIWFHRWKISNFYFLKQLFALVICWCQFFNSLWKFFYWFFHKIICDNLRERVFFSKIMINIDVFFWRLFFTLFYWIFVWYIVLTLKNLFWKIAWLFLAFSYFLISIAKFFLLLRGELFRLNGYCIFECLISTGRNLMVWFFSILLIINRNFIVIYKISYQIGKFFLISHVSWIFELRFVFLLFDFLL